MHSNSDVDYDRVVEWSQKDTSYLVHIQADAAQLNLQVEQKHTGDLWHSEFTNSGVEQLTEKAKNRKKYPIFVRMLVQAFQGDSNQLNAQILSYRELSSRFSKGSGAARNITAEQASKRFLILTYKTKFEQMQFPLPLMHYADPPTQRLRMIIKRMTNENQLLREGSQQGEVEKDLTILRYENQSLKRKLKQQHRMDSSSIVLGINDDELKQKTEAIEALKKKCGQLEDMLFEKEKKIKADGQKIQQLQQSLQASKESHTSKSKESVNKIEAKYEHRVETLIEDMTELVKELDHSKEKQKKLQLKISTLQKEIEALIAAKNMKNRIKERYRSSSPESQKSERSLSVRSARSRTSQKSGKKEAGPIVTKKTYGMSNLKKSQTKSNRKPSVYDSDTESSRMRRMNNGKSSPYRQGSSILTANNRKTVKPATSKQRSRSKSKQRKTVQSPRHMKSEIESQMLTEGYNSSSEDQRYERIENYMSTLREKKAPNNSSRNNPKNQPASNVTSKIQQLEEMIKRAANSTKKRQ